MKKNGLHVDLNQQSIHLFIFTSSVHVPVHADGGLSDFKKKSEKKGVKHNFFSLFFWDGYLYPSVNGSSSRYNI